MSHLKIFRRVILQFIIHSNARGTSMLGIISLQRNKFGHSWGEKQSNPAISACTLKQCFSKNLMLSMAWFHWQDHGRVNATNCTFIANKADFGGAIQIKVSIIIISQCHWSKWINVGSLIKVTVAAQESVFAPRTLMLIDLNMGLCVCQREQHSLC